MRAILITALLGLLTVVGARHQDYVNSLVDYTKVYVDLTSRSEQIEKLDKAVILISTGMGHGTGWLIDKERGWFITNYHVADEMRDDDYLFVQRKDGTVTKSDKAYYFQKYDLAIIEIKDKEFLKGMEQLSLDLAVPAQGETLYGYGNGGFNFFWGAKAIFQRQYATRNVGAYRAQNLPPFDYMGYYYKTGLIGGHSGSPVVNSTGKVVAVHNLGTPGIEGFGIPAKYVQEVYLRVINMELYYEKQASSK